VPFKHETKKRKQHGKHSRHSRRHATPLLI
jgi:hypothetical protein